jgi:hypothetical protein
VREVVISRRVSIAERRAHTEAPARVSAGASVWSETARVRS